MQEAVHAVPVHVDGLIVRTAEALPVIPPGLVQLISAVSVPAVGKVKALLQGYGLGRAVAPTGDTPFNVPVQEAAGSLGVTVIVEEPPAVMLEGFHETVGLEGFVLEKHAELRWAASFGVPSQYHVQPITELPEISLGLRFPAVQYPPVSIQMPVIVPLPEGVTHD